MNCLTARKSRGLSICVFAPERIVMKEKKPEMVSVMMTAIMLGFLLGITAYMALAILLWLVSPAITKTMTSVVVDSNGNFNMWAITKISIISSVIVGIIDYGNKYDKLNGKK